MGLVIENSKTASPKLFTCLSTGLKLDSRNLLKFVLAPDNSLTLDLMDRLPGEGFRISASREVLEDFCKKDLFSQTASCQVIIREDFISYVETALVEHFNSTIGFCRRAGFLIWGFEKVRNALIKKEVTLRIEALDGSTSEKRKLDSITIVPVLQSLYAYELATSFRRERLVHCALIKTHNSGLTGLASSLKDKSFRLAKFRMTV
ncbi:MAG: DUF448 domain-containing protein [Pseudomonadota bacterium]|jgi:hypothetical protein|nr:hypothetical protein [Paracoccaceae bacterium]MEC7387656.1 DUF448 domain-containing protein [Pseudomonadota bacterium]GIR52773.1 MAG: hypothetical protein CM15mP62_02440 [Rhodospirillaceae bacterium]MEC8234895.1 DUF448 domain-containing protein [Pseudomonadota bacterium]MEC8751826.1 DUF448 domain-containing protein [Pseudomonadota bacterium]|tara:strand:- start:2356 stop:2970 length:615 start_codon:yes stop_codon:yes gene_type:complete